MHTKLEIALDKLKEAQDEVFQAVSEKYPVGTTVHWTTRNYPQEGVVQELSPERYDSVHVKNNKTGSEMWVNVGRLSDD